MSLRALGFAIALTFATGVLMAAEARVPLEVLMRLKDSNLDANPALRTALMRALDENQGTPQYLELVRAFNLKDQAPGLIRLAIAMPDDSAGADALQRAMDDNGGGDQISRELYTGPNALALIRALGNISHDAVTELLRPLATGALNTGAAADPAVRTAAVRALAQSTSGSRMLLALAKSGSLPPDARTAAASALAASPIAEIKNAAAEILPPPVAAQGSSEPLPAILARKGDAARGEKIFFGSAACFACHRVNGRGAEVGPELSTIGDKFGKQAMYANIVEPSAGIVFGYEAFQFELKSGAAVGMIASETDDEVAVKSISGITIRYKKADVVSRTPVGGSLMPPGLLSSLEGQDVADLLEYLANLKKS